MCSWEFIKNMKVKKVNTFQKIINHLYYYHCPTLSSLSFSDYKSLKALLNVSYFKVMIDEY